MSRRTKLIPYDEFLRLCPHTNHEAFDELRSLSNDHHVYTLDDHQDLIDPEAFIKRQRRNAHKLLFEIYGLFSISEESICPSWYLDQDEYSIDCKSGHPKATISPSRDLIAIPFNWDLPIYAYSKEIQEFTTEWNLKNRGEFGEGVGFIAFSPDQQLVVSTSLGHKIDLVLWRLAEKSEFNHLSNSIIVSSYYGEDSPIAFSINGEQLFVVYASYTERYLLSYKVGPFDQNHLTEPNFKSTPSKDRYWSLKPSLDCLAVVRQREDNKYVELFELDLSSSRDVAITDTPYIDWLSASELVFFEDNEVKIYNTIDESINTLIENSVGNRFLGLAVCPLQQIIAFLTNSPSTEYSSELRVYQLSYADDEMNDLVVTLIGQSGFWEIPKNLMVDKIPYSVLVHLENEITRVSLYVQDGQRDVD